MKIRHPLLIKTAGFAAAWCLRGLMRTVRYRYQPLGPDVDPTRPDWPGRFIYAIWHENLLLPVYHYCGRGIYVLISQHADGQLLTEMCRHLRIDLVRGSTTRGGVEAVRQLLRIGQHSSMAITPDGPRGPRRQVQPGMIYLASQTGMPIVPTGFGYQKPWRLKSWDRFAVPWPGSRGTCVTAAPITVPANASREQLEHYRQRVEQSLHEVSWLAESWAESGTWVNAATPPLDRGDSPPHSKAS